MIVLWPIGMATLSDKQIQISLAREVIMLSSSGTGSFPGLSSSEWLTNDDLRTKDHVLS